LTISNATTAENGYEYRAVFSNPAYGGTLTTSPAILTVNSAAGITTNPTNATVAIGNNASFTASGSGNPSPTVQWEVSTDGGITFSNVSNGSLYSGANTDTLDLTDVPASMSGYEYRAVFSNQLIGGGSPSTATTTAAVLSVADPHASMLSVSVSTVPSGSSITVTLQTRDSNGNNLTTGGLAVAFSLANSSGGQGTFRWVIDHGNGIYTAVLTGTIAGPNSIAATINGQPVTTTAPPLTVTPGRVSVTNSSASLSRSSIQLGGATTIVVQTEDAAGNKETTGGQSVRFTLGSTSGGRGTFGPVKDNGNGTYTATFTGALAGNNTILVSINGAPLTPPLPISVTRAAVSLSRSLVILSSGRVVQGRSIMVTLQARDAKGNKVNSGGLSVHFSLGSTRGGHGKFGPVTDNKNGTYSATFTGTLVGNNTIKATIGGAAVTSRPPSVTVAAPPVSLSHSFIEVLPRSISVGSTLSITLQAVGVNGHNETSGGLRVAFKLRSITGATGIFGTMKDNRNGTYTVTFKARGRGTNKIVATIGGKAISTAPTITVT
jgi:adhesin/invasin